jgi:UDP-N-acetylglucosamine:LPS N-acetylglucosamine transferase
MSSMNHLFPRVAPAGRRRGDIPAPRRRAGTTGPVLLVSTQGGHLAHLLALRGWWQDRDRLWVCPRTPDVEDRLTGERLVCSHSPTTRNVPNLVRNSVLALELLLRERPSMVVSAGAGVAVPFFVAAWLLRIPTVFIEVYDRVDTPTMTGRLCGPFTTRRMVQWQSQLDFYPDAHLVGPLL